MLVFIRLGLVNSFRQLGRSLLVMIAMVLAAMSMTSALSFSQGEMKNSYQFYRELLGGEILVSPVRWAGQQVNDVTGGGQLEYHRLQTTGQSWLEIYYPELYKDGYFGTPGQAPSQTFQQQDLDALAEQPGIAGYSIHPEMQVDLVNSTQLSDKSIPFTVMPLPNDGQLPGLETDLSAFAGSSAPIALINTYMNVPDDLVATAAQTILTEEVVSIDEDIRPTPDQITDRKLKLARTRVLQAMQLPKDKEWAALALPTYKPDSINGYVPDYSQTTEFRVQVAGQVSIPTRTLSWINAMGATVSETAYLHGTYLWVPQATWMRMWQQASGTSALPLQNVSLKVKDMDQLDVTIKELQANFPQFTFVSVSSFAQRMELSSLIDRFYRAPSYLYRPAESTSLSVPMQLGPVMGILFFLIAGMLIASRMLTGAAARRLEVGILKALGARRRDIAVMVLTEAMIITVIGTTIGFLLVRMGGVIMEIGNDVPLSMVAGRTLVEYATVCGLASIVSLFFALLPAIRMSNLTVMEVLRGE